MDNPVQKLSVIGLGYIGLPTAAIFASRGLEVVGVDVTQDIVDTVNAGEVHIVEPDLDIVVRGVVSTGNLRATMQPESAEAFIIAVPTPFAEGKRPDLGYIKDAAEALGVADQINIMVGSDFGRTTYYNGEGEAGGKDHHSVTSWMTMLWGSGVEDGVRVVGAKKPADVSKAMSG